MADAGPEPRLARRLARLLAYHNRRRARRQLHLFRWGCVLTLRPPDAFGYVTLGGESGLLTCRLAAALGRADLFVEGVAAAILILRPPTLDPYSDAPAAEFELHLTLTPHPGAFRGSYLMAPVTAASPTPLELTLIGGRPDGWPP